MAGRKEEWSIWDRRFQFGYSCLNQRLKTTEGATQQIAQLDQQTKQLAASCKHLQEDNSDLRDRIQQLDEQIQDLTASSRDLKEEIIGTKDRILQVEQEGTHRDRENQRVQEQLKENNSALDMNFKCLSVSIKGMNETARAERAQRGDEMQHLRAQVEDLIATRHTTGGYARDGESRSVPYAKLSVTSRIASRDISQATTEDESIQDNKHAEQQQAAHHHLIAHGAIIKAQTSWTLLEDHLRYAEKVFKQCETEAVLGLVSSVRENHRITLQHKLEKRGEWTWQAAMQEAYKLVEAEKTIKRRSARLMAGPSQQI